MKNWQKYLFAIVSVGSLIYNVYKGVENNFADGYAIIISFGLFSILSLSKFTKYPL